ncbi:unnamed protein product, partial [Brassica oleracea]
TTVFYSGVRCRWESTPAYSFQPSVCKSGVRCRSESTPASSSEPLKASKIMLSTTLTSSSVVESTSLPCLLSMNGENTSDSFPS